jgi:16S rRNA processing protein RimM
MTGIMQELLGRIVKIHGCEGAVKVKVEKIFSDNIPEMETVFLELEGRLVPFFIEHYQNFGHENVIFWFEDYKSVEKVTEFIGCKVYILAGDSSQTLNFEQEIIGFEILTGENELVGSVIKVTENPGQWLITVISESGNEILIPFHEDLVIKIDKELKTIIMSLPEGLSSLN